MLLGVLVLLLSWIGEVCWLLGGSWQVSSVGATVHRGTSPRVMLMSLVLSVVCFLVDNDTRCFWMKIWLTLGLATSVFKNSSHDVSHGRGEVCGVNGIEICLMRLLSGWFGEHLNGAEVICDASGSSSVSFEARRGPLAPAKG